MIIVGITLKKLILHFVLLTESKIMFHFTLIAEYGKGKHSFLHRNAYFHFNWMQLIKFGHTAQWLK